MEKLNGRISQLEGRINNPSKRGEFIVSYVDGWIICTTVNNSKIRFNHNAHSTSLQGGVVQDSIKLLKEKGENGIRIGTRQGEPEKDTFEKFLRNYGQPERLGSYFPSVLSYLGLAIIFRKGRGLHIKINPNASI